MLDKPHLPSSPFEESKEKTYQEATLNAALWTIISLLVLVLMGNYIGGKTPYLVNLLNLAFIVACFGLRFLTHKGKINQASLGLLFIGTIHLTMSTLALGTVRTPTSMAYLLVIIISGLQFGKRGIWQATTAVSVILGGIIWAEKNLLLPNPDYTVGITQWITLTVLLGLTGNLIFVAVNNTQHYLKIAQKELSKRKESENKLRLFSRTIEQSPISIVITDPDGKIENVNPKFLALTGYNKEEVLGQKSDILKSGKHSEEFYKELWGKLSNKQEWHGEFYNKKKNGEFYWEQASISPVLDEKGKVTHYVAVKENITDRKEIEKALVDANEKLEAKLKEISSLHSTLRAQALRDPLTGLYNRRYMDDMIIKEISRSERSGNPLSIILLDLDGLKKINDTGGHAVGDYALRSIAGQLNASIRQEDTICRYGGDEFAVILPNTKGEDAFIRAEEWRIKMEQLTLIYRAGQPLRITFTAGIATYPEQGQSVEEIFDSADIALYRAKNLGRNRVELYSKESF